MIQKLIDSFRSKSAVTQAQEINRLKRELLQANAEIFRLKKEISALKQDLEMIDRLSNGG